MEREREGGRERERERGREREREIDRGGVAGRGDRERQFESESE